jgi:hypothetical protein
MCRHRRMRWTRSKRAMTDHIDIQTRIATAIDRGDAELLSGVLMMELEVAVFMADTVPTALFDWMIEQLGSPAFLGMAGSWHLLYALESHWEIITPSQKDKLLVVLESIYPRVTDWMSWFVISELLGEYYADGRALEVLERIRGAGNEEARSLIPVAYEHLARSLDGEISAEALRQLRQLTADPSDLVRAEAMTSMQKLERTFEQ